MIKKRMTTDVLLSIVESYSISFYIIINRFLVVPFKNNLMKQLIDVYGISVMMIMICCCCFFQEKEAFLFRCLKLTHSTQAKCLRQ